MQSNENVKVKVKIKITWIFFYGSHSFTCKLHNAGLYLISDRKTALLMTCDNVHLIAAYYSSIDPERMKS